jgi:type II secretory pathway component GspD/PulD (secretin)
VLPGVVLEVVEGQPAALNITAASSAELDRVEAIVNALDRVDIAGDAAAFAPTRATLADARTALLELLATDGSIAGLALASDAVGARLLLRGERARLDLALEALAAIDAAIDADAAIAADPAQPAQASAATRGEFAIARLPHASPQAALTAARALLPERARREVRAIVAPDARGIVLAGDAAEIALWRAVLSTTKPAATNPRSARLVRLSASDAPRTIAELREQFAAADAQLVLELDPATRELALIGAPAAIEQALDIVRRIEGGRAFERESALVDAGGASADLARLLRAQAPKVLPPRGTEPTRCEPLDALGAVLVTGEPGAIDFAIKLRDALRPGQDRARAALDAAERAQLEARGLRQPHRTARIVPAGALGAAPMAERLSQLLGAAIPGDAARSVPLAEVRPLPSINALYISGEPAQLALFGRVLAAWESDALPATAPLRLLEIRCNDARAVERGLRERFDARDGAERAARPVLVVGGEEGGEVGGEKGGALSVATHPEMLVEVARAIDALDARADGSSAQPREVFGSTLAQSDPVVVARALNGLFPLPPMPRDANGHALPHLREPRELFASADAATRTVWVDAARERPVALDALVGLLDKLALPADAEARLIRVERGDITRVVQSLRDLAARGSLSQPAAEGAPKQAPGIVIDADPMSRTLIVVGDATAFAKTEEVLQQLGVLAAPRGLRVIDARGLDPEQLRTRALRLAELEPAAGIEPLVVASADAARGVVTAVGDEDALERFAAACRRLVPRAGDQLAASGVGFKQRPAASVAPVLDGISFGSARPAAMAAATGESAVIAGSRDAVIAGEMLARALDSTSDPLPRMLAAISVRDATLPAEAISEWFASRGPSQQQTQSAEVRATPDGDQLMVSAHLTQMGEIGSIVRDLGISIAANDDATVVNVVPLSNARAETLAKLLDQCADSDGAVATVRADATRNALVIAAPTWWCATLESLVESLDISVDKSLDAAAAARAMPAYLWSVGSSDHRISVLPVRNAAVEPVADLVRAVLGGARVTDGGGAKDRPLVSVGQDAEGRRLLVSGPSALCDLAEAIVARIDGADSATAPLRASAPWIECAEFALAHVDAEVAAGIVESVLVDRTRWPADLNDAVREGARLIAPRAVADRAGGRIYVSAPPQLMSLVRTVVERLDVDRAPSARWEMRVYPMSRALVGPAAVAARQAVEARRPAGGQPPRLLLDVEEEAEALVATGEPSWLDVVDSAVRSIEVRGPRDAARVRIVSLSHAEATRVAALPGALLGGEQAKANGPEADATVPLRALADAKANAVVLLATPGALELAEEVLVELDAAPDAPVRRSMRLYELQSGEAAVVAKSIVDLFETDDGTDPLPTVRVQPSRNSLLVRATEEQRVAIELIVAKADASAASRARRVRVLEIGPDPRSVDEVARVAAAVIDPRAQVRFVAEERGNRLYLFGDDDGIDRATSLVSQVFRAVGTIDPRPRLRELPASADPRAVGALARAALATLRLDLRAAEVVASRVVLDDRSDPRAIALVGSGREARIAETVIELLVRGQSVGPFALRALSLQHADATRVAAALREQAARADGTLLVVDDPASGLVVLLGSPREVDQAARVVARLDRGLEPAAEEVRLLPLRALGAAEARDLLGLPSVQGGATVLMSVEPLSNTLLLRGIPTRLATMSDLLARLDDPAAKGFAPFEIVRPMHLAPSALATAVESAVCGADPTRRERMRLVADDATQLLFVRADEALMAEVRAAIAAADVPPPPPPPSPPLAPPMAPVEPTESAPNEPTR